MNLWRIVFSIFAFAAVASFAHAALPARASDQVEDREECRGAGLSLRNHRPFGLNYLKRFRSEPQEADGHKPGQHFVVRAKGPGVQAVVHAPSREIGREKWVVARTGDL